MRTKKQTYQMIGFAMNILPEELERLTHSEGWPLICALEAAAANTDTDPRWKQAALIRKHLGLSSDEKPKP